MLRPEYFEGKEQRIIELYRQLQDFILSDIAGRLLTAGEMTATADRLIWKLKQMGESQVKIERKLRQMTGLAQKELRALLQDAVIASWKEDNTILKRILGYLPRNPLKNPTVIRIMDAQYKRSLGELWNLTRSTMNQSQNDLINMLDEADMRVAAGVQSYSAAICDILDRYAGKGIEVLYPTGTKRTLEAAVLCCVRTSMVQMAGQVTMEYVKQAGTNLIITSAHTGARFTEHDEPANHMSWQGRIFYVSDSDLARFTEVKGKIEESGAKAGGSKNNGKYPDFVKTTGYGTGEGLCGYNCRHSFGPYDERFGNPWRDKDGNLIDGAGNLIDSEESKQKYRDSQKLRAMERAIRKTKTQLLVKQKEIDMVAETDVKSILQEDYNKLAYKLRQQNKAFNKFAETKNLRKQYDRIKVSGFKRAESAKANGAATRYANQNGLSGKEDVIHTNNRGHESLGKNMLGVGNSGSASSEGKYIGKIDYEKAPEAVSYFNQQIKTEEVENAVVIDKSGNVYQFIGDSKSVNISDVNLESAYITHNHPKSEGIVSFGEDDFIFLRNNQSVKLFGCCNEKYEYKIEVLKDFSKLSYNEIYLEGFKFADMADYEAQDAAMKVLEERGFIKYVKREIE